MLLSAPEWHLLVMGNTAGQRLSVKQWPTRHIVLVVLPGTNLMTLAGPVDVFTRASTALLRAKQRSSPAYEVVLLTAEGHSLMTPPVSASPAAEGGENGGVAPTLCWS